MKYVLAVCLALLATTAFAGTTPHTGDDPPPTPGPAMDASTNNAAGGAPGAAPAPQDPCSRNPATHMTIPGIGDIDTVRCEISVLQLAVAHAAIQSAVDATQSKMREADQTAAAAALAGQLTLARGEIEKGKKEAAEAAAKSAKEIEGLKADVAGLKSEIERLRTAAPTQ